MLARIMRQNKIDRRTRPAKALHAIFTALADDWEGPNNMSNAAKILCDRTAALGVKLMLREQRMLADAVGGKDDTSADKGTVGLYNAFGRMLGQLDDMRERWDRERPDRTPTLAEYLAARTGTATTAPESFPGETSDSGSGGEG
jgi:hypothetical protein